MSALFGISMFFLAALIVALAKTGFTDLAGGFFYLFMCCLIFGGISFLKEIFGGKKC